MFAGRAAAASRALVARLATSGRRRRGAWRWCSSACCCRRWRPSAIGIHAIFGAFLLGAIIPHDSGAGPRADRSKLEDLVTILLLPAFFAFTGMRTQIGLVSGAGDVADLRR